LTLSIHPCRLGEHALFTGRCHLDDVTNDVVWYSGRSSRDNDDCLAWLLCNSPELELARPIGWDVERAPCARGIHNDACALEGRRHGRVHRTLGSIAYSQVRLHHIADDPTRSAIDPRGDGDIARNVERRRCGLESIGYANERHTPRRLRIAERDLHGESAFGI